MFTCYRTSSFNYLLQQVVLTALLSTLLLCGWSNIADASPGQWHKQHSLILKDLAKPRYKHLKPVLQAWSKFLVLHRRVPEQTIPAWWKALKTLPVRHNHWLVRYPNLLPWFMLAPHRTARLLQTSGVEGMKALALANLRCGKSLVFQLSKPLIHYPLLSKHLITHMGLEGLFIASGWGWLFGWLQVPKEKYLSLALVLRRNHRWLKSQRRKPLRKFMRWFWGEPLLVRLAMEKPALLALVYPSNTRQINVQAIQVTKGMLLDVLPLMPPGVAQSMLVQQAVLRWHNKALMLLLRYQKHNNHLFWDVFNKYGWRVVPILWKKWGINNVLKACQKKHQAMPWLKCKFLRLVKGGDPLKEQISLLHKNGIQGPTTLLGLDTQQWPMGGIVTAMVLLASGKSMSHEEKFWFAFDVVLLALDIASTASSAGTAPPGKSAAVKKFGKGMLERWGKAASKNILRRSLKQLSKRSVQRTFHQRASHLFRRSLRRHYHADTMRRYNATRQQGRLKKATRFCKKNLPLFKEHILCARMALRALAAGKRWYWIMKRQKKYGSRRELVLDILKKKLQDLKTLIQQENRRTVAMAQRRRMILRRRAIRKHGLLPWFTHLRLVLPQLSMKQLINMALLTSPGATAVAFQPPRPRTYEVSRAVRSARFLQLTFADHRFFSRIHKLLVAPKVNNFALLRMHEALDTITKKSICPTLQLHKQRTP